MAALNAMLAVELDDSFAKDLEDRLKAIVGKHLPEFYSVKNNEELPFIT